MYYFAYGSLLSRIEMRRTCPDALPKFKATLPDHKLIFAGWSGKWRGPVASVKPCEGEKVIGGVYEISQKCLSALDAREGYHVGIYDRHNVVVSTERGDVVEAVVYVKIEQSEETRPSWKYLAAIKQGYEDWGVCLSQADLEGVIDELSE